MNIDIDIQIGDIIKINTMYSKFPSIISNYFSNCDSEFYKYISNNFENFIEGKRYKDIFDVKASFISIDNTELEVLYIGKESESVYKYGYYRILLKHKGRIVLYRQHSNDKNVTINLKNRRIMNIDKLLDI